MKLTHEQMTALRKASAVLSGTGHHDEASEINRMLAHPDHSGDGGEKVAAAVFPMAQPGHCINCGLSVSPSCACARGRDLAAQSPLPQDGDERARFEAWANSNGFGPKYRESMFAAWQAALASNKAASETKVQKGSWVNEPPVMPWEDQSRSEDEKAAIRFYVENPSAALLDFGKRVSSNKAAAVAVAHPTPISITTDQIAEIAGKYNLGNPRLDALRGFVNEVIIVNGAEYAKSE